MEAVFYILLGYFIATILFITYRMGQKQTKRPKKDNPLTEDEQLHRDKIKRMNEHFQSLMNYDVQTALQPKKVIR